MNIGFETGSENSNSAGRASFVSRLRSIAVKGLGRMYLPDSKRFVFCVRRNGERIIPEGASRRYTAITLIGLAGEAEETIKSALGGQEAGDVLAGLAENISGVDNLGDVALSFWAACALDFPERDGIRKRLVELNTADGAHPVVEASWVLDSLCLDSTAVESARDRLADRLISSFNPDSAVFPHVLGSAGARSHVSCFADMVYPIHALSNYYKISGRQDALDAAAKCAEKICQLQGEDGQWWWHYDRRTGEVVEGYPVYSVHQDAMAPMALFALAAAGGPDFGANIQKGLAWLERSPEIDASLVDYENGVIWRKVARREPGKLSRYVNAMASRAHPSLRAPGIDAIFPPVAVDYESRPYHLGWLLYAWPAQRASRWDGSAGTAR